MRRKARTGVVAVRGEEGEAPLAQGHRVVAGTDQEPVVGEKRLRIGRLGGDVRLFLAGGEALPGFPGGETGDLRAVPGHGGALLLVRRARAVREPQLLAVVEEGGAGKGEEDGGGALFLAEVAA